MEADQTLVKNAEAQDISSSPFIKKELLYVPDLERGSYGGRISFDTTPIGNQLKWCDYSEAFIQIPFNISFIADEDVNANMNAFQCGLKNGYFQIIDSLSIEYNGTEVVSTTPYTNFHTAYKLMTSFSEDDLNKYGPSIGFWPDSAGSFKYNENKASATNLVNAGDLDGLYYSNNRDFLYPPAAQTYRYTPNTTYGTYIRNDPERSNTGYLRRKQLTTAFDTVNSGLLSLNTAQKCRVAGKNHWIKTDPSAGAGAGSVSNWVVLATIRLKDITGFCEKIPNLIRGASLRININYNSNSTTITATNPQERKSNANADGTDFKQGFVGNCVSSQSTGNTNPILWASMNTKQPATAGGNAIPLEGTVVSSGASLIADCKAQAGADFDAGDLVETKFQVSCGVCSNEIMATTEAGRQVLPMYNQCRLYVPCYILNKDHQDALLLDPIKNFTYERLYFTGFNSPATETAINRNISTGILRPKTLLVIALSDIPALQEELSPFSSTPGTTTPLVGLTNINVALNGSNIFNNQIRYEFEEFMNEVKEKNAIDGGVNTGLTCGLVSAYEWSNAYRYYVFNLERRLDIEWNKPVSIDFYANKNDSRALRFFCFVEYSQDVTIDISNSAIV